MVPEKTRQSSHDFLVDGLQLQIDGEWLTATDTTLGADNGIGVAAMLALLESTDVCHGPLEALFTVTEETTMAGALGLDAALLNGTVLLNLDTEEALQAIDQLDQLLKQELNTVEPYLCLNVESMAAPARVFTTVDQKLWLNALHSCHHGVKRYSDHFEGVVETSNNLGVLLMKDGQISVDCFTRHLIDSATIELADNISGLFSLTGAEVKQAGFFPGWQPDPNSDVLTRIVRVYQQLNGSKPEIKIIHAALECGILSAAKPGVDMISFGPQIENPHTPAERVRIDSVDRFW